MKQITELLADEPIERLQEQGYAAVLYSEQDDWTISLTPESCRLLGERLLTLAAEHIARFGKAPLS